MSSTRWDDLTLGDELGAGLAACRLPDGREAVLRRPSSTQAGRVEIAALRAWEGRCTPGLLAAEEDGTALLLERIRPGTPAVDAAADEVARLLHGLHVAPPPGMPPLELVVRERLAAAAPRITAQRLGWAQQAMERLAADAPPPVLLHGSLGPAALLRCARRGLCAVAPSPCAGDAAYDAAWWVHADGAPGRRARFEALAAALHEATGRGRARLRDWCGVVAVHGTSEAPAPR